MAVPTSQSGGGKATHGECLPDSRKPCSLAGIAPNGPTHDTTSAPEGGPPGRPLTDRLPVKGLWHPVAPPRPGLKGSAAVPRGDAQRLGPRAATDARLSRGGRRPLPQPRVDTHHLGPIQQLRVRDAQRAPRLSEPARRSLSRRTARAAYQEPVGDRGGLT